MADERLTLGDTEAAIKIGFERQNEIERLIVADPMRL
jgi:hypothetical protein